MAVVMSPDGNYIASAGLDAKIYVWSVEAALKQQDGTDDANAKFDGKIKKLSIRPRDVRQSVVDNSLNFPLFVLIDLSLASDCLQAVCEQQRCREIWQ